MPGSTSGCPNCRCLSYFVMESRKEDDAQRRRRKCKECGYKATTYEISASDYDFLKKARKVERIFSGSGPQLTCERSCEHWKGGCGFDFPDAGGAFAEECLVFQQKNKNK